MYSRKRPYVMGGFQFGIHCLHDNAILRCTQEIKIHLEEECRSPLNIKLICGQCGDFFTSATAIQNHLNTPEAYRRGSYIDDYDMYTFDAVRYHEMHHQRSTASSLRRKPVAVTLNLPPPESAADSSNLAASRPTAVTSAVPARRPLAVTLPVPASHQSAVTSNVPAATVFPSSAVASLSASTTSVISSLWELPDINSPSSFRDVTDVSRIAEEILSLSDNSTPTQTTAHHVTSMASNINMFATSTPMSPETVYPASHVSDAYSSTFQAGQPPPPPPTSESDPGLSASQSGRQVIPPPNPVPARQAKCYYYY